MIPPFPLSQIFYIFLREIIVYKVNSLNIELCQTKLRVYISIFRSHFCETFDIFVDAVDPGCQLGTSTGPDYK